MMLTRAGIIPTAIFAMETDLEVIKKRVSAPHYNGKFGVIDVVLETRLNRANRELPLLTNYYETYFNNVRYLSTIMSNWGLVSFAQKFLDTLLRGRADVLTQNMIYKKKKKGCQSPHHSGPSEREHANANRATNLGEVEWYHELLPCNSQITAVQSPATTVIASTLLR